MRRHPPLIGRRETLSSAGWRRGNSQLAGHHPSPAAQKTQIITEPRWASVPACQRPSCPNSMEDQLRPRARSSHKCRGTLDPTGASCDPLCAINSIPPSLRVLTCVYQPVATHGTCTRILSGLTSRLDYRQKLACSVEPSPPLALPPSQSRARCSLRSAHLPSLHYPLCPHVRFLSPSAPRPTLPNLSSTPPPTTLSLACSKAMRRARCLTLADD
jgi:hypothetical protein